MTASKLPDDLDTSGLLDRIAKEADRITSETWGSAQREATAHAYEVSARHALRVPMFAERSVVLRRVAKRIVPRSLVPITKRVVRGFDRSSRGVAEMLSRKRGAT
jgi:hypothetical protein